MILEAAIIAGALGWTGTVWAASEAGILLVTKIHGTDDAWFIKYYKDTTFFSALDPASGKVHSLVPCMNVDGEQDFLVVSEA